MTLRLLLLVFVCSATAADAQELCTGFSSGNVGNQYIEQQFSSAVVRVQDVGTAYLIDSKSGFLLTAGHVLDEISSKNQPFEIVIGQSPYSHLAFRVIKRSPTLDIALLQLTESSAMNNVRPLDVAFEPPDYDSLLFVMGYPQYGQQNQIILRSGSVKVSGYSPGGLIEISHITAGGNSGGPLIDGYGDVVATAEEEIAQNKVGRYLPLIEFLDILESIPVSARMQQIEKDLVSGKSDINSLKQLLKKTTQSPTNVELYVWTHDLGNSPTAIQKISKYVKCPLMPALIERHIPDALLPFMTNLKASEVGQLKLALAQREYGLGHNDAAAQLANGSAYSLRHGGSAMAPLREEALLLGQAIEEQKKLGTARVIRQDTVPVMVTLDSGKVEKYLVQWVGSIDSTKTEQGHPAEPLEGLFTDTRQCQWSIQSEVLRKVYYLDKNQHPLAENAVTKIFSSGFSNQGGDFVFTNLRPENCNEASDRYGSDLKDAETAVGNTFPNIITADRERVLNEIRNLPNVHDVMLVPADQQQ